MLSSMLDEFIFESISSRIIVIENNNSEHKGYRADLIKNNDENNLHYIIGATNINKSEILSGYIYTNVNKFR